MNEEKLKEIFSDKAYVESIVKMSAEDAAKSLQEKGVEVSAGDLVKLRDFMTVHKEELANGELSEEALAEVAGGLNIPIVAGTAVFTFLTVTFGPLIIGIAW